MNLTHILIIKHENLMIDLNLIASINTSKAESAAELAKNDPYGLGVLLIALIVVFVVLISLFLAFKYFFMFYNYLVAQKRSNQSAKESARYPKEQISGEIVAAIAMTLHLYKSGVHDEENTILTMKKTNRAYSPWSSKLHGLQRTP
jgi:glutaconyl-CoA/methylmalonyl-CoA decarboxylase subunit delta